MDSYTVGDPIFLIFAASMQFMHICLQFTHFFCGARNVAIYAFWEPKGLNFGLQARKTKFPALARGMGSYHHGSSLTHFGNKLLVER